jgi:hypothetical protein
VYLGGANMSNQCRAKLGDYRSDCTSISRRNVLRAGATIIPASIIVPAWLTANAQVTTAAFDYYVSPTGSDTNPGTLAAPWSIKSLALWTPSTFPGGPFTTTSQANCLKTAGKRIGFLPGTYNMSAMMFQNGSGTDSTSGAIHLIGGSSASATTYWGSSNSAGQYSPRTATLVANDNGIFGGKHNAEGPMVSHVGVYPQSYPVGYATIDGLRFTGFSYKGVRIGGASSGGAPSITNPVLVTNCEFFGGGFNSGDNVDNCAALWTDGGTNYMTISNNWFHDTVGHTAGSGDHLDGIIIWGFGASNVGTVIEYNTVVRAGNIYGKEGGVSGTIIQNNYLDCSNLSVQGYGYMDFTGNGQDVSGLTATTIIRNNILVMYGTATAIGGSTLAPTTESWMTPVRCYNNTVVSTTATPAGLIWGTVNSESAGIGQLQYYNNIYSGPASGSWNGYGALLTCPNAPKVWDYNLMPANLNRMLYSNGGGIGSAIGTYTTSSAFSSALAANGGINGAETHSITGAPTFVGGAGTYAAMYQLAAGSLGKGSGSTNGTSSGSATDMGAWGNGATQIGCNFTTAVNVPDAPVLTIG